jgi:hypothetical protein
MRDMLRRGIEISVSGLDRLIDALTLISLSAAHIV